MYFTKSLKPEISVLYPMLYAPSAHTQTHKHRKLRRTNGHSQREVIQNGPINQIRKKKKKKKYCVGIVKNDN
jgi:hypothetical protein